MHIFEEFCNVNTRLLYVHIRYEVRREYVPDVNIFSSFDLAARLDKVSKIRSREPLHFHKFLTGATMEPKIPFLIVLRKIFPYPLRLQIGQKMAAIDKIWSRPVKILTNAAEN